jgi:predicted amidohydrolase YtcJ
MLVPERNRRSGWTLRSRWGVACVAAIGAAVALFTSTGAQVAPDTASLVLRGGKVITLDAADRVTEAIAVRGNRVLAVGSNDDIQRLTGRATKVFELQGRSVTPGFIDAHTHTEHTAEFLTFWVPVHSPPLPDAAAILDRVRQRVKQLPEGTWVIGQGTFGQVMPTPAELTREFPSHPVVLRWSRHSYVVNRKALEVSGITASTPDPQGGKIHKGLDGQPTGLLEESFDLLKIPPYPAAELRKGIAKTLHDQYLSQGVTSVYDMPGNQAIPHYEALHKAGQLPVRLRVTYTMWPGSQSQMDLDTFLESGLRPGQGDDWLLVGGIKLFVDGVDDNYKTPMPTLLSHVRRAHTAGWQLLIHANSPRTQDMAMDAIEAALREFPRADHRHRIEHLGGSLDEARLRRAKALGLVPVPTPGGIRGLGMGDRPLGAVRRLPYKSLIGMGFRPPGNSDTAGTRTEAINPLPNIHLLATRTNGRGEVVTPEERLSVTDALRVYTLFPAYAGFEDTRKGSLEPGKLADLVVLSEDVLTIPAERLGQVKVDATIVDGVVRYERKGPRGTNGR